MVEAVRSLGEVLTIVHEAGGYYWVESEPCPLGPTAEAAEEDGFLRFTRGDAQGVLEGYELTRKGREFLGLPPTIGDQVRVAVRRLLFGAPAS